MQAMIYLLRDKKKGFNLPSATRHVAVNVIDQWIHCNVYTKTDKAVKEQVGSISIHAFHIISLQCQLRK